LNGKGSKERQKASKKKPQKKKKEYSVFIPAQEGLPFDEEIEFLEKTLILKQ
jgi:hypothetical protein